MTVTIGRRELLAALGGAAAWPAASLPNARSLGPREGIVRGSSFVGLALGSLNGTLLPSRCG